MRFLVFALGSGVRRAVLQLIRGSSLHEKAFLAADPSEP